MWAQRPHHEVVVSSKLPGRGIRWRCGEPVEKSPAPLHIAGSGKSLHRHHGVQAQVAKANDLNTLCWFRQS